MTSVHCIVGNYDNIVIGKSRVEIPVNGERSNEVVLREITGIDDLVTLTVEIQVCVLGKQNTSYHNIKLLMILVSA